MSSENHYDGKGLLSAASAFLIWGGFPLYFHLLNRVPALQVIANRMLWSCVVVIGWLAVRGQLPAVRAALTQPSVVLRLVLSATLITCNWSAYVWAVLNGRVVEASLGYFIGPLVNVLLGVVILSERLTRTQWTAIGIAVAGVSYLTLMAGGLPWVALILAISFACYGLVRKVVQVEALPGLAAETLLLAPVAVAFLGWCEAQGNGVLGHQGAMTDTLLVLSGPLTAIALFLFAVGTRLLPYSTVGVLQYITPTLQFLCGVFVLHEPFDRPHAVGFTLIWTALILYAGEGLWRSRKQQNAFA